MNKLTEIIHKLYLLLRGHHDSDANKAKKQEEQEEKMRIEFCPKCGKRKKRNSFNVK